MSELLLMKNNGIYVIKPKSNYLEINFKNSIEEIVKESLSSGKAKVLVNLDNIELINSHGVAALIFLYTHLQKNRGLLAFCCVNELMVQDTFRDTGIEWLCHKHIYATEAEAIKGLNNL